MIGLTSLLAKAARSSARQKSDATRRWRAALFLASGLHLALLASLRLATPGSGAKVLLSNPRSPIEVALYPSAPAFPASFGRQEKAVSDAAIQAPSGSPNASPGGQRTRGALDRHVGEILRSRTIALAEQADFSFDAQHGADSAQGAAHRAAAENRARDPQGKNGQSHAIDLGLDGGVTEAALAALRDHPTDSGSHSVGLLSEGLAERDAARGLARGGAAVHAGYEAARLHAPRQGIGVFDVLTDQRGFVVSVTLVSSGPDEPQWRGVGENLGQALRGKKLRIPPGGNGLLTRLRIERGQYAASLAQRDTLSRAAALGQGEGDRGIGQPESTRAQLEPGAPSPSLGITFEHRAHPTRVVVVFEKVL